MQKILPAGILLLRSPEVTFHDEGPTATMKCSLCKLEGTLRAPSWPFSPVAFPLPSIGLAAQAQRIKQPSRKICAHLWRKQVLAEQDPRQQEGTHLSSNYRQYFYILTRNAGEQARWVGIYQKRSLSWLKPRGGKLLRLRRLSLFRVIQPIIEIQRKEAVYKSTFSRRRKWSPRSRMKRKAIPVNGSKWRQEKRDYCESLVQMDTSIRDLCQAFVSKELTCFLTLNMYVKFECYCCLKKPAFLFSVLKIIELGSGAVKKRSLWLFYPYPFLPPYFKRATHWHPTCHGKGWALK